MHEYRVRRAFTAPDIDKLWLSDITKRQTAEEKLQKGLGRTFSNLSSSDSEVGLVQ